MSSHRLPPRSPRDPLGQLVRSLARAGAEVATGPLDETAAPPVSQSAPQPASQSLPPAADRDLQARLDALEQEVREVRTRINALFFAVLTAALGDLAGRVVL
ncbi:MAG: hypothetical protein AB7F65_05635 [Dehalococcoidia bacterium]